MIMRFTNWKGIIFSIKNEITFILGEVETRIRTKIILIEKMALNLLVKAIFSIIRIRAVKSFQNTFSSSSIITACFERLYSETRLLKNLVVNKLSVITNSFWSHNGHFSTQINPVIKNLGYNEEKWPISVITINRNWSFK